MKNNTLGGGIEVLFVAVSRTCARASGLLQLRMHRPVKKQSRKGNDKIDDGRRAGVLGMLGKMDARGARNDGAPE